ncbi:transmembrane protein, putative (macronuclear) [Tetrahymena thermophila SB210]|uniref:Transmembrane protein, putative n=1 Tax=Tetrahymena thermophila (strain SB210) TaxID=312017 RepID=I7MIF6_TETTS|nr:transmembrane protein, putative [Tetrahymena thermophila SB210]EAS04348.2 transmembrane protein, putative [Tetrahymena thermophila SB210]|eukprot:XP_001024593.2 transmembrane protein, putative [Tetrahymena thermophila SB210]
MGKRLDRFLNFIKQIDKIDIYGQKISLKFMKESEYKTRFGGLITLVVGLLTGLWTLVSIYQLIYSSVNSIISQEYVMDAQELNSISFNPKSQNTFQVGFFNKQTQLPIDQNYFKIVSYYNQECDIINQKVEVLSFQEIQSKSVELTDCQDLIESSQEYQFLSQTKDGYFCFNKDKSFTENEVYPEIQQTVNCRNSINILVTKSKDLDDQILQNLKQNSTLSLSVPTTLVDYTDIQNPFDYTNIMKQFDTNLFFSTQSNIQQKLMIQINFQALIIEDERNYSIQQNRLMKSFAIQSISDKLINSALNPQEQSQLKNTINDSDVLFKIKISFSEQNYNKKYIRSFQSIPSILGSLGGGIKIVVLMGFLIVSPLCQIHFQKTMLNEVFNFENDQDDDDDENYQNNFNLQSLKSLDGIQTNNKNHISINNNSNISQAQNQDNPKKQQVSKGLQKINNFENQQNILQTSSPKYIQALKNVTSFIQIQNINQKQENLPTSTKSITNFKQIKNIEKPIQKQINQITNNYTHQNSMIFSKHSLQQENNNDELNFTQLSQLKGGERKNKMKEIIKGTIFINSQRQIDSQQCIDQNSPLPKFPQRLSFLSNAQSQKTIALTKKKQNDQKKAEEQIFEKYFKTTFNPLKISFIESLFYYIWPFGKFKRTKEQMSYSIDKLNYHLDSIYIIKKLLEIDKLKMLLLDENQIKLLEFLPKPTINLKKVVNQQESFQVSSNLITEDDQKKINILYQDTRNELTKATQAFQAFQSIKAKSSLTQIDRKLIDLLDPKIADYFNQDSDDNKSQIIQLNQMSLENENNQLNINYDKDTSNKIQLNYQQENTTPQSQNLIKEIYQKSKGSSGYISSPLEIYRSTAKKASMFKQPHIKRGSLHVTSQYNRQDEVEEYQKNNQIQIKYIQNDGQSDQHIPTRLTRLKSYSSEDINKMQRRSKESSVSSQQSKEGSSFYFGVKNISAQYPKSLEMQYVLDDSHLQQDVINGDMEESQQKQQQNQKISLELNNEINHSNPPGLKKIFSSSLISSCSHSIIADESIKLQSIDCQNLQMFTKQNKFCKSSNLIVSQNQKQAENQSEQINTSSEQTYFREKKNSSNEENKLVSQYEIQINLHKKVQSQENMS